MVRQSCVCLAYRHRKDGVPKKLCGLVRWSRHRKDGVPKKLCGSVRWSRHRKDGVPKKLCGSARWPMHRKDDVPKRLCGPVRSNFVAQQGGLGTGKMVCLKNFVAQ